MREQLDRWLDQAVVRNTIVAVIIFNAIILGLETSQVAMARFGDLIVLLDKLCLAVFVIEIVLKLIAKGPRFFKSGWNIFDFVIVGI